MAMLFNTLGAAAFAGFAALLTLLLLQTFCGIYLQAVRRKIQQHTDARVAGICDALGGIRTLKMMVAEYTMQVSFFIFETEIHCQLHRAEFHRRRARKGSIREHAVVIHSSSSCGHICGK